MIPKEILDKVHKIEVTTSRLVTDVFAGQYHSVFKGRGMEFDEVREYQVGDDIRSIDWNVTARTGRAHVKKFIEERELTVMIMVDASRSCHFGSVNQLKKKLAAEIAAVFAFSAIHNSDKIGLIIFTDKIEKFIPPRKGSSHVLRLIREILFFKPEHNQTDLGKALEYLSKVTARKTVSFLISDFFVLKDDLISFEKSLAIANRKHDLIAVTLNDPCEINLPECGLIELQDSETGESVVIDSSSRAVRTQYAQQSADRITKRQRLFDELSIDHIDISTDQSYVDQLIKFFKQRKSRR